MTNKSQSAAIPFTIACIGIATFAGMDVVMKGLSISMGAYNATMVGIYVMFAPFFAVVPEVEKLPTLAAAAILGLMSLLLLSWAYARAEARILIPVEYTAFIWAALFGWLIFAEEVTLVTILGTLLIVIGCLVASRQKPGQIDHVETTAV